VIVVDDGSADATAWIAEAAGATLIRHERNQGKGAALNTGFRAAVALVPRAVVTLDADFQHHPREISHLLGPVLNGEADIVVGSRYLERGGGVPRHRVWGHRLFTWLTNVTSGVKVSDSQSGFRAFSPRAVEVIGFSSDGFSVESEMQFQAQEHGLRIVEAPVSARYLDEHKRPALAHGLLVLNGVLRLIGQYRPLLSFGLPGLVLALVGLGWGVYVVLIYQRAQQLAMGYALISVLLFMLGGLSLFTGIILHSVRALLLDLVRHSEDR
jgi:glycosyltransferase involved in cell wall biosynthesis